MDSIYFSFVLIVIQWSTVYSLECLSCQQIDDPHSCNITITCPDKQVCFLDVQGGIYSLGCANNQHCGGVAGPGIVGRDVNTVQEFRHDIMKRQSSNCFECCSTDICNSDLCKHPKPTQCVNDEAMDCARLNTLFHICLDVQQASLVCPKFCDLCTLVNGNWTLWSTWSNCDVTCGKGVQTRSRSCSNPAPANGGRNCTGNATETKLCQRDLCPVHGGWSTWAQWGSCSATCDVGMQRRDRSCSKPYPDIGGDHCFGEFRDDRTCLTVACSDGGWSSWSSWSTCSESCGGGIRSQTRTCTNPKPSLLGKSCDGTPMKVSVCNRNACFDGGWSSWSSWGTCSESCGGGIRSQTRTCTNPKPSLLGKYCEGTPIQVSVCNKQACSDHKVAFTAYGISDSSSLVFPHVVENYGNGYDSSTGKFTCQIPGIYIFSFQISKGHGQQTDLVQCFLRKNSISIVGAVQDPFVAGGSDSDKNGYSLSLSGTFHLNKNDIVYVGSCSGISAFYTDRRSSFTGVLVTPDN